MKKEKEKKVAKLLHTKKWRIEAALGEEINGCQAITVDDAAACYHAARDNSRIKCSAQQIWDKLSLLEVEQANTPEELRLACMRSRNFSPAETAAIKKIFQIE